MHPRFFWPFCFLLFAFTQTDRGVLREHGKDYALFFAVNDYEYMDDLQQPIQNARDIAAELKSHYGFEAIVVENPTLDDVDDKLAEYERKFANGTYAQDGQLFIFFSGHGLYEGGNGYFMTRQSNPDRPQRTALEYDYYRNKISNFACQHILVAIDACHSASFDPDFATRSNRRYGRPGEKEFDRVKGNHDTYRARVFWTSDGVGEATPDNSRFAYQLLQGLQSATSPQGYLRSSSLYTNYLELANPKPGGGRFEGDEPNACFLFFQNARVNIGDARADRLAYETAKEAGTLAAYRQYLGDYPNGEFRPLALARVAELEAEEQELRAWEQAKRTDTRAAYQSFIDTYPNSPYRDLAEYRRDAVVPKPPTPGSSPYTRLFGSPDPMVFVEGGTFTMGCLDGRDTDCQSDEKPEHKVTLSSFYISKYEVTQAEWRRVMGSDPETLYNKGCDACPVENVAWFEVQDFIQKLNQQTGQEYRLPTEAEWEYAARGGKNSRGYLYAGSNALDEVAWYSENYQSGKKHGAQGTTHPVGQKTANELGLYDMSGNVWEWCEDVWHDNYVGAPTNGTAWTSGGESDRRVVRGGSWYVLPDLCRVAARIRSEASFRTNNSGFRLAR